MWTYVLRRTLLLIPVFFVLSATIFSLIHLVPGDPVDALLGPGSSVDRRQELMSELNLDRSLPVQYVIWLKNFLSGDMGMSIIEKQPVADMVQYNLPFTIKLGLFSLLIAFVLGLLMGILSASAKNTYIDYIAMVTALFGVTVPAFWLGLIMILIFSVVLGWFPVSGSGSFRHLVLPAITVGLGGAGLVARITRVSMLEVYSKDFIVLLHAKGLSQRFILIKHVFRNALVPVITILGLRLGWILGGAVAVEIVFSRPGVGQMLLTALFRRDYPVVQASLIFLTMAVVMATFLADILYAYADPRVRDSYN